jgi:hypothetical protein
MSHWCALLIARICFLRTTGHSLAPCRICCNATNAMTAVGRFLGASVVHGSSLHEAGTDRAAGRRAPVAPAPGTADVRCFNFAVPSATMGDLYCLLSHFKTNKPDLIVLTINPKFFCRAVFSEGTGALSADVGDDRAGGSRAVFFYRVTRRTGTFAQKRSALLNETIRRHWALPRWLPLWARRLSGRPIRGRGVDENTKPNRWARSSSIRTAPNRSCANPYRCAN